MIDLILILLTIFFLVIAMYQADKNKNKSKKSIPYKLSKMIANILNFVTFLDTQEVNNIIDDIENENNNKKDYIKKWLWDEPQNPVYRGWGFSMPK